MGAADARHGAFLDRRTDEGVPRRHHTRRTWPRFTSSTSHPRNFILAVSGDFKTADLLARLEKGLAAWPGAGARRPAGAGAVVHAGPGRATWSTSPT